MKIIGGDREHDCEKDGQTEGRGREGGPGMNRVKGFGLSWEHQQAI